LPTTPRSGEGPRQLGPSRPRRRSARNGAGRRPENGPKSISARKRNTGISRKRWTIKRWTSAAIGPDGLVYKCVEDLGQPERAYASVFHADRVKLGNLVPWLSYDWFQDATCRQCPVLLQCAGGCPHKRLFQSDTCHGEDFCYWHVRGDLENRIREQTIANLPRGR
jgi:radical SAM protein with 4Fe4S-binding SPASM domain